MPKKYKKRKPKKKINKSIYKSNINKQHVKVNINTGSTPSGVSYMQAPAYPNLMDINTAVKGTVEDLLKKHHQQIPINKPIPHANNQLNRFENTTHQTNPLDNVLKNHNNTTNAETKQDPIIVNLETGEYKFPAIEYKPDSEDEKDEEYEPKKGLKDYFKSPFKNNKTFDETDKKKRNWKKEEEARERKREEKKKEYEEKYPESQPALTKSGKLRLR